MNSREYWNSEEVTKRDCQTYEEQLCFHIQLLREKGFDVDHLKIYREKVRTPCKMINGSDENAYYICRFVDEDDGRWCVRTYFKSNKDNKGQLLSQSPVDENFFPGLTQLQRSDTNQLPITDIIIERPEDILQPSNGFKYSYFSEYLKNLGQAEAWWYQEDIDDIKSYLEGTALPSLEVAYEISDVSGGDPLNIFKLIERDKGNKTCYDYRIQCKKFLDDQRDKASENNKYQELMQAIKSSNLRNYLTMRFYCLHKDVKLEHCMDLKLSAVDFHTNDVTFMKKSGEVYTFKADEELMNELTRYIEDTSLLRKDDKLFIELEVTKRDRTNVNSQIKSLAQSLNMGHITPMRLKEKLMENNLI